VRPTTVGAEVPLSQAVSGAGTIFHTIFAQSPEAIGLTRARDGAIVEVNQEWVRLTGFAPSEVIGRTALDIGHWPSEEARETTLQPLKRNGRITDADVTLVMRDGMSRMFRMNASLVRLEDEEYILIYLRDVTAEQLAQEALRAGERVLEEANRNLQRQAKLHAVTESVARVGYWVTYPGDPEEHFSAGFAALAEYGTQRSAPAGEHARYVLPEDSKRFLQAQAAMDGQTIEYRWSREPGRVLWLRSRLHSHSDHGVQQAAFCVVQEISAERQAVEELNAQLAFNQESLYRLQDSETRFRSLTALSSDWYWEQDEQFRFVRVDGSLETVNVLPPENYIGKTRWESGAQGVTEDGWLAHRAAVEAHEVFRDFEMQRLRNDGSLMWVTISGAPIYDSQGQFTGYRGTGRDISARRQAEADIERLAFFDALTGLPNRRLLIDRLTKALDYSARHISHGALLFIDLDNFKVLNDTLGHHMGDELLKQVAERLGGCVRHVDTVARLGGDEFVVMLEDLGEPPTLAATMAEAIGKKVLGALNLPFDLGGQRHHSSPSIGITLFFQNMHSVDELLKRADLAMYQAKGAGRNTWRFFDPAMQAEATERVNLESDLRQGLAREEFQLYYQPVVDEQRRATGVEALIRWRHPVRGLVSPAAFIPVAEHTSLILPMGNWVLKTACLQLVTWSANPATQRLSIAVNVSTRQFRQPEFSDQLLILLRETGANPYRLKLELTESLLLHEMEDAIKKMTELRSIGVSFSLDDFGTGYSSLSYLKRLPLDQLKIDQSFVRDVLTDPNDAAIARTILNLAQNLDLGVVAEGVETEGQREFLLQSGCRAFQGYLFGRPVPVDQLMLAIP
jgi:diguanylate cyclase (GGDEF)-like protein/PAS domain S-box-containing protein